MIDRWMCRRAMDDFSQPYDPAEAITGVELENFDTDELNVIFPPWHGGDRIVDRLTKRLARRSSVLKYSFHDRILEPDIERVQMSFNNISRRVARDLTELQHDKSYNRIHLIGLSLGNVALAKTARLFDGFDEATMVTAATFLSDAMWEGSRTQHLRAFFEEQGVTQKQLRVAWHDLAPLSHTHAFTNKNVNLLISRSDTIIPAYLQMEMPERLRWAKARVTEKVKRMGHVATLTSYCIKG